MPSCTFRCTCSIVGGGSPATMTSEESMSGRTWYTWRGEVALIALGIADHMREAFKVWGNEQALHVVRRGTGICGKRDPDIFSV